MTTADFYIQRCLQIAKNGIGTSRPNPSVGAVIVIDDKIIGEGFTAPFGGNHAEVNAINAVVDKELLKKATLYVTLEPCSHFGKTPPCADLIVKHRLKKVVIGCLDSNPKVAGKGVERLKNAGIEVVTGVLEDECRKHHKRFFTHQEKKRPYIILKWAATKDGFIYPELDSGSDELDSKSLKNKEMLKQVQHKKLIWISNSYSQQLVHKLRAKEHAILVGTNTVLVDNPKLNVRSWFGNNPVRIILDRTLKLSKKYHVFDGSVKSIILTEKEEESSRKNVIYEKINFSNNLAQEICDVLNKHQIQSLIVEGGTKTLQTFIDASLWDEALVFTGDIKFNKGIKAPELDAQISSSQKIMNDTLNTYYND